MKITFTFSIEIKRQKPKKSPDGLSKKPHPSNSNNIAIITHK